MRTEDEFAVRSMMVYQYIHLYSDTYTLDMDDRRATDHRDSLERTLLSRGRHIAPMDDPFDSPFCV